MRAPASLLSRLGLVAVGLLASAAVFAAGDPIAATEKQPLNVHAIAMFLVFVAMTMGITYWASNRTKSAADFYTAGGGDSG